MTLAILRILLRKRAMSASSTMFKPDIGDTTLPRPTGPHIVGCTDVEFSTECGRHVQARLYYPAAESAQYNKKSRGFWLPSPQYYPGYGYYLRVPSWFSGFVFGYIAGHVQLWAVLNAQPLVEVNDKPLVVFSHGIGGMRTTYSTICSELASHGFLVGAIEHRDGSASLTIDGLGRRVEYQKPTVNNEFNFRNAQVGVRVEEMRGLCRLLLKQSSPKILSGDEDIIRSLSNSDRDVYAMGHSMGAATVFMAASQSDLKIVRLLGLDPWMYPLPANFPPGAVPTLILASQNFEWPDNDERILQYLEKQTHSNCAFLTIGHADHADQSDWPVIAPRILRWKMRTPGSIDPDAALEITRQVVLDFMENGRLVCPLSEHVICGSRKS